MRRRALVVRLPAAAARRGGGVVAARLASVSTAISKLSRTPLGAADRLDELSRNRFNEYENKTRTNQAHRAGPRGVRRRAASADKAEGRRGGSMLARMISALVRVDHGVEPRRRPSAPSFPPWRTARRRRGRLPGRRTPRSSGRRCGRRHARRRARRLAGRRAQRQAGATGSSASPTATCRPRAGSGRSTASSP